jgi:uncharacterized protein (TIGR00251 family)
LNLNVKVHPRAKRNTVEVSDDGAVTIRVTAAPEKGKANIAAVKLLASRLDLPRASVSIIRGHTSRNKVVRVNGIEDAELKERLTLINRPVTAP